MPKRYMEKNKTFYLLGFESGIMIALEMAAKLEEKGWIGTVFCIGGSPDDICAITNHELNEFNTDKELQIAVLKHLFTLMTGADEKELNDIIINVATWEEQVERFVRLLKGRVKCSYQFIRGVVECTYSRLAHLRCFKTNNIKAVKSLLISIRPSLDGCYLASSAQKYSKQKVIEYDLNVPFGYIAQDLQCAAIINDHLNKYICGDFEDSEIDLCEYYSVNPGFFNVK